MTPKIKEFQYKRRTIMNIDLKMLLEALDSVVWYNGYGEMLFELRNKITDCKNVYYQEFYDDEQMQMIYMIMVCLYGDYGTSPRCGWLEMENKDEIIKFIDNITETDRRNIGTLGE